MKYVYVVMAKLRTSNIHNSFDILGVARKFKKAKKIALETWNGKVTVLESEERYIEKVGLHFAWYEIALFNELVDKYTSSKYYVRINKIKLE